MWSVIGLSILFVVYFLPTIIASAQQHKQLLAVFLLNFFGGWTGVAWLIALVWGATGKTPGIGDGK
jgi:hypothetical protein